MSVDSLFYGDPRFLQRSEPRSGRLNLEAEARSKEERPMSRSGHDLQAPTLTCYSSRKAWEKLSVKGWSRKASIVRLPVTIAASTGIPG